MISQAKWIWKTKYCNNDYVIVGKDFNIESEIIKASIQISAHNHFKLSVNGISFGGYVSPAPTVANKEKYYLEYDISKALKQGNNHIEIIGLYLGGDGQNYVNAYPGIIAGCKIKTIDSLIEILTDQSWYSYESIPYKIGMPFQQNRRVTPVEYYDSRIVHSRTNKNDVVLSKMNELSVNLVHQEISEGINHEIIQPKCLSTKDNIYVFDTGKIVSGFVHFELIGVPESIIKIRYSEDLLEGRVKHNVANEFSDNYLDIYVMNREINQIHQADFTYKAFRYFEIEGYPGKLFEKDISVIHAGTDIDYEGYIKSENCVWINQLNDSVKNTQLNNVIGQIVDCPHREQAQYLGDTFLQSQVLNQNAKAIIPVIKKALNDFKNMLHTDGKLPFVAPTNENHEDFQLKIPEYNLYFVLLVDKLNNLENNFPLANYYDSSYEILRYFIRKIDGTGLVAKKEDWHIDDWPYPSTDNTGNYLTFENILVYVSLKAFKKHCEILGREFIYHNQMELLYKKIRLLLMKNELFIDSLESTKCHPGINAFALNYDMFDSSEIDGVLKYIVDNNSESSVFLTYHVLEVLLKNGEVEAAISRILSPSRGWITMLNKDKTLWEGFDDIESHSHAWTGYPLALIQRYILGIKCMDKAHQTIRIEPQIAKDIKDIQTKVWTGFGWLEFSYLVQGNTVEFKYSLPKNLVGQLVFETEITELKNQGKIMKYITWRK